MTDKQHVNDETLARACESVGIEALNNQDVYECVCCGLQIPVGEQRRMPGRCSKCNSIRWHEHMAKLPRPAPDLLAALEGWLLEQGLYVIINVSAPKAVYVEWYQREPIEEPIARSWDVHNPGPHLGLPKQEAREKAAVAAVDKLKGKG